MEAAWALALLSRVGRGTGGAQVGQGGGGSRTYPASDRNDEQLMEFQGKETAWLGEQTLGWCEMLTSLELLKPQLPQSSCDCTIQCLIFVRVPQYL